MANYNKQFIKKSLLYLAIFLLSGLSVKAQHTNAMLDEDTTSSEKRQIAEPGIYFAVSKENSSAAVSSVSGEQLYKTPTANLSNTLYGLMPGLTAIEGSGLPGYDQAWLTIRGIGSYNYGSYAVFVDGFQTNDTYYQYLMPSEIESISILKDAAALAPLGMKGANGAIWIETKRGRIGKPKVQVQFRTGMQQPTHITKPLQSYDYAMLYNEAVSNDNNRVWSPAYSQSQLDGYKNGTGINTDWFDQTLKSSAPLTSTNVTFDGGIKNARYFVLLGYVNNQGLYNVKNNDTQANAQIEQYNIRSNFDFTLFDMFEGKVNLGGRIEDRKYPGYNGTNLFNNLERYPNIIYPVQNDDGTWTGTTVYPNNPVASIRELGYFYTRDRTLQANFSLKEKLDFITQGLYLSEAASFNNWTRGSYNVFHNYARYIAGVQQTPDVNTNYTIQDDNGTNQWRYTQMQLAAGYSRQFGKHQITSAVTYLQNTYNVDANQNGTAGINTKYAFQNLGGRVHYEFDNRYTGEFSFAYSGSDNYAKGNRFGFYPALSGAWIVSNESFLKNKAAVNFLKIRLSAGKTGYDAYNGGRYLYQQYYTSHGSYPTGNSDPTWNSGLIPAYIANPDIFAEESMKYNAGIDATFFKRLNVTLDAYMDKRSGIVSQDNSLPAIIGETPPYRNLGKVTTKGLEFNLNYHGAAGQFTYNVGVMISCLTDKIDYMAELTPPSPLAAQTGQPIGTPFGYDFIGFYDMSDFNADGTLKQGIPTPSFGAVQPGDMKYRNVNGDEKIDEKDMVRIGNREYPNMTYSFHAEAGFHGFDFSVMFQGITGRDVNILNDARNKTVAFENNGNAYKIAEGRWAYYPDQGIDTRATATYPRLSTLGNTNNYQNSTFWMKNGDYLRLRNIELGYSIPKNLLSKTKLSNVRIFINGTNLLTMSALLKNYDMDPETLAGYPAVKSYNAGINVGF